MDKIVVLDFGGQYAHLIANRIRRLGVYSEIHDSDVRAEKIRDAKGIILSGGPAGVFEENAPTMNPEILSRGIPILGICYGHQLLMHVLGAKVEKGKIHEFGKVQIQLTQTPLFEGLNAQENVWMSHADTVLTLPQGFECVASTRDCAIAAVHHSAKRMYGLQFHPEVTHTEKGMQILDNFIQICKCKREWTIPHYIDQKINEIRAQVGNKKVFLLASGGVDSTVCLALLNKALGPQNVKALHIDNGFMRANESMNVVAALRKQRFDNFMVEDASEYFLQQTHGLVDPEEKRKVIGKAFIEVQQRVLEKLGLNNNEWLLGQGTIYPDTIESGRTKHAQVIKTHHNRVAIIQELLAQGKVIEPLNQLYKDEVREVGTQLGLPTEVLQRHPFPGPGLGIRVLCNQGNEPPVNAAIKERVHTIAKENGFHSIIPPLKSVGVQGDNRTYQHPAILIGKRDWSTLEAASTRITNEVREINRVTYLCAGALVPRTRKGFLSKERLDVLRQADAIVEKHLREMGLYDSVWQFPVVLAPIECEGGEAIILRPVYSTEAMTARFADLPFSFVEKVSKELMQLNGVGAVLYDVTHKPPGTIEWE